jgi:hypothetical protein
LDKHFSTRRVISHDFGAMNPRDRSDEIEANRIPPLLIRYQDQTVNPAAQTVEVGNTRVPRTSREWAILMQLL